MNMGMILHLSAPGMENAEESGSITWEIGWLSGEGRDCLRGCLKQRRICEALMRANEIPELCGDRTGNHEVVNRHQSVDSGIEPFDSLLALTRWAVAVAARSENPVGIRTIFTGTYDGSQLRCPALDDCPYHLFVIARHPSGKGYQIRLAVGEKYITYGHGRIRS